VTAAGDQSLAVAYSQVGVTEQPPNSNNVPYWDAWGGNYGAWCAAFVSWVYTQAGHALPPIDGAPGFSYCPSGQIAAYTTGHEVGGNVEPGDCLIFSWEPWHMSGGIAVCSSGVYAGAPAGDHTGFFAGWLGDGYMRTVEGNTSQSSWDNGGAVLERTDRYTGQICAYCRHAALGAGGGGGPIVVTTYAMQDDRIDLVGVNSEGHIYHKWYEGNTWYPGGPEDPGGWEPLTRGLGHEALAKGPPTCTWFGEQFQVFYPRNDGQAGQLFIGPGTNGWVVGAQNGGVDSVAVCTRTKLLQTS
jgi:hypothetical protein